METEFSMFAVAAFSVTMLTQIAKRQFPKIDPRYIVGGFTVAFALIYATTKTFVPVEIVEKMATFGSLVWVASQGIYRLQK